MEEPVIAVWITASVAVITSVYTIIKNGRSRTKSDTQLKTELKMDIETIQKLLDDPHDGLGAIRREVSSMKLHCAGVTSTFEQRIQTLEKRDNDMAK